MTLHLFSLLRKTAEAIALGLTFAVYLLLGAKVLSVYEPEMDFFKAFYFNFVTLTTIGLGDFVPRSFDYLFVTLCYIGIGLALTTMAIEMAADLLRRLHYVGRKMENMANAVVWFGGKKMTMKRLVKNLGDQFNIPEEQLAQFNLDEFVEAAMKVEAGEIKTLRVNTLKVSLKELQKMEKAASPVVFRDDGVLSYNLLTLQEDTFRTMETLPISHGLDAQVPRLDLDYPNLTDSSLPTSFDEEYMKTMSMTKRGT
ncbi:Ion channel [Necator americanus]|uniref:Ion channel n=1 Tax=Necator americanus TaxID=51031 RepID=W2THQ1_NECAM|nr:Ion channel [Necator americanus]ETN81328.1 Ion channel [Necator americanus]